MKLLPFDPRLAEHILPYYYEPEYSHWARGIRRFMTLAECERLPDVFGMEFLHILDEQERKIVGLIKLKEEAPDVYMFGIVVSKEFHKQGIADEAVAMTEEYVKNKKRGKVMMSYVVDNFIGSHWSKQGWVKGGEIPGDQVDGKEVNMQIYYKRLR